MESAGLLNSPLHSWAESIGIAAKKPERCCPEVNCCCSFRAYYCNYHNDDVHTGHGERSCNPLCPSGRIESHLAGRHVAYEYDYHCCGAPTGDIHVFADGRKIGKVEVNNRIYCSPCTCCGVYAEPDVVLVDVKDEHGHSRYTMREHGAEGCCGRCCPHFCGCSGGCCDCSLCYVNYETPIYGSDRSRVDENVVGEMTLRHPRLMCLSWCCPLWFGFRRWPRHATEEDRLLLVGMLHGAMWMQNGFARLI